MADYNSVQEILDSQAHLECLLNNTKNDDGTLNCPGVEWFMFNGAPAATIYYSGNSWVGFGSNEEQLKVNRRDAAIYSFWREEGTLYGEYNFLRLKWQGYAVYSSVSSAERLTWEVVLFSTGDILLNVIDVPATTGANSLFNYAFTMNGSNRQISFYHLDDTGTTYSVVQKPIEMGDPAELFFLIRSDGIIYTFKDGSLSVLAEKEMESAVFLTYGCRKRDIDFSALKTLHDPDIYEWRAEADRMIPSIDVSMSGITAEQTVMRAVRLDRPDIKGIKKVTAVYTGDPTVSFSVNDGVTYQAYLENAWQEVAGSDGMSIAGLETMMPDQWDGLINGAMKLEMKVLLVPDSSVKSITITYIN